MKKLIGKAAGCLLLTFLLVSCHRGRHPQSWEPKSYKKTTSKAPAAYKRQAF